MSQHKVMGFFRPTHLHFVSCFFLLAALFVLPFSHALLEFFFALCAIVFFADKLINHKPLFPHKLLLVLLCLLFLSSSVSAFDSGYPKLALLGMIKLLKFSVLALIACDFAMEHKKLDVLTWTMVVGLLVVLSDSIIQRLHGADLIGGRILRETGEQPRLTGPFIFYGLLAAYLMAWMPPIFFFLKQQAKGRINWKGVLLIVLCISAGYVFYKTHSRGAWIAFFCSCLTYAIMSKKRALILTLVISALSVALLLPKNALIHFDIKRKEQSLVERFYLWHRAVQVIQAEPFFGCGVNTYVQNYPKYDKRKNWRVPGYYAHNGYLQLAAETGLISLAFFLALVSIALKTTFRAFLNPGLNNRLVSGFGIGFLGLLLHAGLDTTLHNLQSAYLIWGFLGLLCGIGAVRQTNIEKL